MEKTIIDERNGWEYELNACDNKICIPPQNII